MSEYDFEDFYIGGGWRAPATSERVPVIEAATELVMGSVPLATQADVDVAVAAATAGLDQWRRTPAAERSEVLLRFADALDEVHRDVAEIVSRQNGMPVALSRFLEGRFPVALLRYYGRLAADADHEDLRLSATNRTVVRRVPVGVVAAIVPWNYPVTLAVAKLAPAIAAGCAVVVKPAPNTALDSYLLAAAAERAGVPDGVVNWVPGGREVGAYLVQHPGVAKVAFTGSTQAGRAIAQICGDLLRPVSLELGGKSAAVVLDDADLSDSTGFFAATLANNGQTCVACSRILAPRSRYREVVDFVADVARSARVGDPLDRETAIGPLATAEHRSRVERYVELGRREGARLLVGGGRPAGQARGWFVEPTVFADVDNRSTIAQEEIFGPVLAVIPYNDEAEALRIANDSVYGLGGSVWSANEDRAATFARQVHTGTIGVNGYAIDLAAPFGGVKHSGMGREFGPEALSSFQTLQSVYLPRADAQVTAAGGSDRR